MSGICGIIHWDKRPGNTTELELMAKAAAHRGADGIHYRICGQAGFAHLALHITPESVRERQPLASPDGQILLVADARIDNRDDLIRILAEKDLPARPEITDPEIILASYRLWGTDCAAHLVGDFAFAIWDASLQHLFAARDPMGMRAFYYRWEPQRFLFGTEVKQILAAPGVPARIFEPAVAAHLAGYFHHLEWSFYEGIAQLQPAHAVLADARGIRTWRHWDIDPEYRIHYKDERQYVEHFLEIFQDAVRCRVRAVRPVGILLSGGVDSSSVASMTGSLLKRERLCPEFHAYSWAFDELRQCDERHISDGIVQHYRFPVTYVPADSHWPLRDYPEHGPDRDEPYIGVYQALLEYSMEAARSEGMCQLLSGDRGDLTIGEAVYDHPGLLRTGEWKVLLDELRLMGRARNLSLPRSVQRILLPSVRNALWPPAKAPRLRGLLRRISPGRKHAYQPPRPDWLQTEFADRVDLNSIQQPPAPDGHLNGFARRQRHQVVFTPFGMRGMVWTERTQARFGLGFADAWSDRRLAEFVLAVPQRVLNTVAEPKRLVRESMRDIMPEEVRGAVRKIYPNPLYTKAMTDTARPVIWDLLTNSQSARRGYVDEKKLLAYYKEVSEGRPDSAWFWWALTLEMWLRRYWS